MSINMSINIKKVSTHLLGLLGQVLIVTLFSGTYLVMAAKQTDPIKFTFDFSYFFADSKSEGACEIFDPLVKAMNTLGMFAHISHCHVGQTQRHWGRRLQATISVDRPSLGCIGELPAHFVFPFSEIYNSIVKRHNLNSDITNMLHTRQNKLDTSFDGGGKIKYDRWGRSIYIDICDNSQEISSEQILERLKSTALFQHDRGGLYVYDPKNLSLFSGGTTPQEVAYTSQVERNNQNEKKYGLAGSVWLSHVAHTLLQRDIKFSDNWKIFGGVLEGQGFQISVDIPIEFKIQLSIGYANIYQYVQKIAALIEEKKIIILKGDINHIEDKSALRKSLEEGIQCAFQPEDIKEFIYWPKVDEVLYSINKGPNMTESYPTLPKGIDYDAIPIQSETLSEGEFYSEVKLQKAVPIIFNPLNQTEAKIEEVIVSFHIKSHLYLEESSRVSVQCNLSVSYTLGHKLHPEAYDFARVFSNKGRIEANRSTFGETMEDLNASYSQKDFHDTFALIDYFLNSP